MKGKNIPDCFGTFWCLDDCVVSCPFWEECKEIADEIEDEEEDYDEDDEYECDEDDEYE